MSEFPPSELPPQSPQSPDSPEQAPLSEFEKWLRDESMGDPELLALLEEQAYLFDNGNAHDPQDLSTMKEITQSILERQREIERQRESGSDSAE